MAAYTEEMLADKLQRLLPTQISIQTLSHWIVYHRKRFSKQSVQVWEREVTKAAPEKRVTFLYLANDVMQTSRAKGTEFIQEFSKVMVPVVQKVYSEGDHDAQKQIERLLIVWQDRKVLSQSLIDQMRAGFTKMPKHSSNNQQQVDFVGQLSALAERNRRIDDSAEATKAIKPELRTGEALRTASPETYDSVHHATRDALNTMEMYVKLLEEDVPAREALLHSLQQYIATLTKLTADRRAQLQEAQTGLTPVIALLRTALLQPPPSELPPLDAQAASSSFSSVSDTYTPQPSSSHSQPAPALSLPQHQAQAGTAATPAAAEPAAAFPPNLLAVLAQLGPQAAGLLSAMQAPGAPPDGNASAWPPQ